MTNQPGNARSLKELVEVVERGARPEYVFFWGHTPKVPGRTDRSCFSNWFCAPFEADGIRYPTTEHFMMAEKARLFGDEEVRKRILAAGSPAEAKKLGRLVSGFSDDVWTNHRFEIVVTGNCEKFAQNTAMGRCLTETGAKVLVEASPRDRIWGIGMGKDNEKAGDPRQWRGLNLLGFALMEVRERLGR